MTDTVAISHADLCRLSRAFNEVANLSTPQDCRINEWLKAHIASAISHPPPSGLLQERINSLFAAIAHGDQIDPEAR